MEEKRINVDDLRKASIQLKKDIQEGLEKEEWDEYEEEVSRGEEGETSVQELADTHYKEEQKIAFNKLG